MERERERERERVMDDTSCNHRGELMSYDHNISLCIHFFFVKMKLLNNFTKWIERVTNLND